MSNLLPVRYVPFVPPGAEASLPMIRDGMRLVVRGLEEVRYDRLVGFPSLVGTRPFATPLWIDGGGATRTAGIRAAAPVRPGSGGGERVRMTVEPFDLLSSVAKSLKSFKRGEELERDAIFPAVLPGDFILKSLDLLVESWEGLGRSPERIELVRLVQGYLRDVIQSYRETFAGGWDTSPPVDFTGEKRRRWLATNHINKIVRDLSAVTSAETSLVAGRALEGVVWDPEIKSRLEALHASLRQETIAQMELYWAGKIGPKAILPGYATQFTFFVYDSASPGVQIEERGVEFYEVLSTLLDSVDPLTYWCLDQYGKQVAEQLILPENERMREAHIHSVVIAAQGEVTTSLAQLRKVLASVQGRFGSLPRIIRDRESDFPLILQEIKQLIDQIERVSRDDLRKGRTAVRELHAHLSAWGEGDQAKAEVSEELVRLMRHNPPYSFSELVERLIIYRPTASYLYKLLLEAYELQKRELETAPASEDVERQRLQAAAAEADAEGRRRAEQERAEAEAEARVAREAEQGATRAVEGEARRLSEAEGTERQARETDRGLIAHLRGELDRGLLLLEGDLMTVVGEDRLAELEEDWIEIEGRTIYLRRGRMEDLARIERRLQRALERPPGENAGTGRLVDEVRRLVDSVRGDRVFLGRKQGRLV